MIIPEDAKRLKSQQLRFEIERVLGSDIGESNIKILDNPISLVVGGNGYSYENYGDAIFDRDILVFIIKKYNKSQK